MEATVLGGVDIDVKSGYRVDHYFQLPMSKCTDECRKVWFFLRNDANMSLPVFTGKRPVPQPN
jgi:hypothetical protein